MVKKIVSFLSIVIFCLACYSGFLLAWPHYKAWQFQSDTREIVKFDVKDEYVMKERILKHAQEMNIPVQENAILVTRSYEGEYKAKVSWKEEVDILGQYQRTFEFHFEVGGRELGKK